MKNERGFILLEIVVALGLLIFGMALLGTRLQRSVELTYQTDELARVVFLAESKLAELDTGLIIPEQDIEHDFGRIFPRYGWRMKILPTNGPAGGLATAMQGGSAADVDLGLLFIQMEILFEPTRQADQAFDFENAEVVQRYFTMRAPPRPLDLGVDFGLKDEIVDKMNEDLADSGAGDIDVRNLDPSMFASLDFEQLKAVLPVIMQAAGMNANDFLNMVPEDLRPQLQAWLDSMGDIDSNGESGGGTGGGGSKPPEGVSGGEPGEGGGRAGHGGKDQGRHDQDADKDPEKTPNDNSAADNDNRAGKPNRGGGQPPGAGGGGRRGTRPPVTGRGGATTP
jgi:uncharacterized membrane protein YgcG